MADAPRTREELITGARQLAGRRLGDLAAELGVRPPSSRTRGKGWAGQLLELALGASAANASVPDFPHLDVEMKSLPINARGWPKESTYVCATPLRPGPEANFETSCVARKLSAVLWVPLEAEPSIPLLERRMGRAVLWSPTDEQWERLRVDFEELMEVILLEGVEHVSARLGEVLQVRPKAASAADRTVAMDANGAPIRTNPKGFYLRPGFTATIVGARR